MRFVTIILFLFLGSITTKSFCFTQTFSTDTAKHRLKKKSKSAIEAEMKRYKVYFDDCIFTYKYSVKQRLMAYPYSRAVKIIAVSYPCWCLDVKADIVIDSPGHPKDTLPKKLTDTTYKSGLHVMDGVLNYSPIKEIKVLTRPQINQLTNIIYNTGLKVSKDRELVPAPFENGGGGCFDPRNALLFVDENGKIFDYFEICFECNVADSKSGKITIGSGCNQKFDLLKKYFISLGIKYGTVEKN